MLGGASLVAAQLQGASLVGAVVNATDFSSAFLWRTDWGKLGPEKFGPMRLKEATWEPAAEEINIDHVVKKGGVIFIYEEPVKRFPWNAQTYGDLRDSMKSIPEGKMRDDALKRVEKLDCRNRDKYLASCDSAATPPREVQNWQEALKLASVDESAFAKALATELQKLVCGPDVNAIHIWRGVFEHRGLGESGPETPALADFIMSKDCPVSASLTEDDKARLVRIKQEAAEKFPPAPASKKGK
jgi:hypothetical protein